METMATLTGTENTGRGVGKSWEWSSDEEDDDGPWRRNRESNREWSPSDEEEEGGRDGDGDSSSEYIYSSGEDDQLESDDEKGIASLQVVQSNGSAPSGSKRKRRAFTLEEKNAVISGVERHGVGKWKEILASSDGALDSRTNVDIKDCFRNMEQKKKRIPAFLRLS